LISNLATYSSLQEDGQAQIALEEIDRATTQLRVTVHANRQVRRISKLIDKLLERHHLAEIAHLSEPSGQP
jgi:hypothetical protein